MIALISNRIGLDREKDMPGDHMPKATFLKECLQAVAEWLMQPIPFPGQWPACNSSHYGYNGESETMLPSSKNSLADVQ